MKKFLSGILSAVLATTIVSVPAMAKKTVATGADRQNVELAQTALSKTDASSFRPLGKRTSSRGLAKARKSAAPFAKRNVTLKASGTMPTLNGCVIFNDVMMETEDLTPGIYEIPKHAGPTELITLGPDASYGGVYLDGKYYAITEVEMWGIFLGASIEIYNPDDWSLVKSLSYGDGDVLAVGGISVDPTTNRVYAITGDKDFEGYQFSELHLSETGVSSTKISDIEGSWNSVAFDSKGQLYGISVERDDYTGETLSSSLCKIDKATGAVTVIGATGAKPQYISSAVIDTATDRMFWNVCPSDETGWMYEVNLTTGQATPLYQLDDNDEITGMYVAVPARDIPANAPGECKNVSVNFDGSALTGKVSLTTPSTFFDGTAGSGDLTVTVLANGEQVATGNYGWGQSVTMDVDLTQLGDGNYTFMVYASNANGQGPETTIKKWIGLNAPAPVEGASIQRTSNVGEVTVNWTPVTTDINGATYPAGSVTYMIGEYANGWTIVAEGITGSSYTYQAVPAGDQEFIQVGVFPVVHDLVGDGGVTEMIPVGTPYKSIAESFPGTLNYIWGINPIDDGTVELLYDGGGINAQDGDNGFIGIYGQYLDTGAGIFSGLVSLGQNPELSFYTYNITDGETDINEISVSIKEMDQKNWKQVMAPKTVDAICNGSAGWSKVTIPLTAYEGKTIQFEITGVTQMYTYTLIDNIRLGSDWSGINEVVDGEVAINAVGNDIVVLNAEGLDVTVAGVDGKVLYAGRGASKSAINAAKGVYVVTAGKTVKKVLVK